MQYLAVLFYLAVWLVILCMIRETFRLTVYHIMKWRRERAVGHLHQRRRIHSSGE